MFAKPIIIIEHAFSGQIWKLETDTQMNLLFSETRNEQDHTVKFSSFNLKTATVNFSDISAEEKWLTGMSGGRRGVLFLYGYQSAQSPEHKGIIALSSTTGEQLWANYNLVLERFTPDGVLVRDQRFQTIRLVLLDEHTGTIKKNSTADDLPDDVQEIVYPQMLRLLPENLAELLLVTVIGEISCLKYNSYLIISLHTLNNGILRQELFLIENQVVVYQDLLAENIQKLQPEAFVMMKNYLVYIKNKTVLKVLNL